MAERTKDFFVAGICIDALHPEPLTALLQHVSLSDSISFVLLNAQETSPNWNSSFSSLPLLRVERPMPLAPGHLYYLDAAQPISIEGRAFVSSSPAVHAKDFTDRIFSNIASTFRSKALAVLMDRQTLPSVKALKSLVANRGLLLLSQEFLQPQQSAAVFSFYADLADYIQPPAALGSTIDKIVTMAFSHKQSPFVSKKEQLLLHAELHAQGERFSRSEVIQDDRSSTASKESLLDMEKVWAGLHEVIPQGRWVWNLQTDALEWDQKASQMFGYEAQNIPQRLDNLLSRVHPADTYRVQGRLQNAIQGRVSFQTAFRIIRRYDREIRQILSYGTVLLSDTGEPAHVIASCMDITETLQQDERTSHFGKALENSLTEILICDMESLHYIKANRGARQNLGYTLEELSMMTPADLKPDFTLSSYQQFIAPLLQGETERLTLETLHQRKDGSTYHVLVNLTTSDMDHRKVLIANILDISSLVEAQQQLRISEERLEYVTRGTSDGLWDWTDMHSDKVWWSPRFYELLGMEHQEIEGSITNFKALIYPQDSALYEEIVQKRLQEERSIEAEIRLLHKKSGYRWFISRGQVFKDAEGNPVRMAGAISDIHERKMMELQYAHTNQMLLKANEYLDNFVFTVAHDLRAPVANLKSLVTLFKAKVEAHDPIVSRIDLSVERLEQTLRGITQILDIQKAANKIISKIHLASLLEKVIRETQQEMEVDSLDVHTDFGVSHITYFEPFLESVLKQLLSNAVKFAKDRQSLRIGISSWQQHSYILLQVSDNGIGIDLERFQHKIFKPFERLSHKSTGQGIGLHLIKTIVEKNGGSVEVRSHLGEGTTFTIYLKPYMQQESYEENTRN